MITKGGADPGRGEGRYWASDFTHPGIYILSIQLHEASKFRPGTVPLQEPVARPPGDRIDVDRLYSMVDASGLCFGLMHGNWEA